MLAPKITKRNEEMDGQDTQGKAKVDGRFLHLDDPVRMEEVSKVVKRLNEGKATFFDNVDNTIIKCLHAAQPDILSRLFSTILKSGNFPQEWAQAYLSPLHKRGSKHKPYNYRGLAISACLGKVYNGIMSDWLYIFMEGKGITNDLQIGFRKGRRVADHILLLQTLMAQAKRRGKGLHAAFVDLKQACDRVDRRKLFRKLIMEGTPPKLVKKIHVTWPRQALYLFKFE